MLLCRSIVGEEAVERLSVIALSQVGVRKYFEDIVGGIEIKFVLWQNLWRNLLRHQILIRLPR